MFRPLLKIPKDVKQMQVCFKHKVMHRKPLPKFVPTSKYVRKEDAQVDEIVEEGLKNHLPRKSEGFRFSDQVEKLTKFEENPHLPDELPKGMSIKDLPSFQKIYTANKSDAGIKALRKEFLEASQPGSDTILLEGKRVIQDAMNAGLYPKTFVFSRLNLLEDIPFDLSKELKMVQIPYRNISTWSHLSTSPGIMATFDLNEIGDTIQFNPESLPMTIILDNVRMPDNIGALTRIAAAVGCKQIISVKECADIWSPKAIRAGAGAHFKVPIHSSVPWEDIPKLLPSNAKVYLADNSKQSLVEEDKNDFETIKKLHQKCLSLKLDNGQDLSYCDADILNEFGDVPLGSVDINDLDFTCQNEVVVVLGGETHGLSQMAHKLAVENEGQRLFVPLYNKIESLNVACAASVILYQFLLKYKQ